CRANRGGRSPARAVQVHRLTASSHGEQELLTVRQGGRPEYRRVVQQKLLAWSDDRTIQSAACRLLHFPFPRRMLMRCSLCALAAAVILTGAARADEADAVKLVTKLGGEIKRDDKQPGKPVVEVYLINTKV